MAHDDLAIARRFEADLRALKTQYPALTAPGAQRRLEDYLEILAVEETDMPPRGQRMMGEDTTPIAVRLPRSLVAKVDAHVERMRTQHPYLPISRVHALSDLIRRACEAIAADVTDTVTDTTVPDEAAPQLPLPSRPAVEPAATSAGGAIPPAPAYEARALTLDLTDDDDLEDQPLGPEPPRPMEPPDVTQASAVPDAQTEDVRPRGRRPARPKAPVAAASQATPKRTTRTTKGRK